MWLLRIALGSEFGRLISMAIVCAGLSLIAITGAYIKGRNDRAAIDRSAALQAQVERLQEDIKARDRLAAFGRELADKRLEEKANDDERIADLERRLAEDKRPDCLLTPADVERLRSIGEDRPAGTPRGAGGAAPARRDATPSGG
jgi:hypothetical protein